MGICFSEPPLPPLPPAQQATVVRTYPGCRSCGGWIKQPGLDYCEMCLQRNAMKVVSPSAPPLQMQYQQQYPQYTYAVQQQPYYPPQQYPPQQYPYQSTAYAYNQQRPQMGTGTAMATGFVVGALMEDMLDPN